MLKAARGHVDLARLVSDQLLNSYGFNRRSIYNSFP